MLYRTFGQTGQKVSVLGYGCMRLPLIESDHAKIDEAKALELVRYGIEHGINYLDTAYTYHSNNFSTPGASEPFVAKAVKGVRDKVFIATKLPTWLVRTAEDMERLLNHQLERLNTDYIDFYLIHNINNSVWPSLKKFGLDKFMDVIKRNGIVRHVGFSFHETYDLFPEVVDYYDWDFCQIQYNYIDEEYQAGKKGLADAHDRGMGVISMEPLRGGELARSIPHEVKDLFSGYKETRSAAEWALRWVWNEPGISLLLSGMNSKEQLEENLRVAESSDKPLTREELEILDRAKNIYKDKQLVRCTSCGYCLPCSVGINIPGIFNAYNNLGLFGDKNALPFRIKIGETSPVECTECGSCTVNCPQRIDIPKEMINIREVYGL